MIVCHTSQPLPAIEDQPVIFLVGPTPRGEGVSWRPEAIQILNELDFKGVVLVPEPADQQWPKDYLAQIEWEITGLEACENSQHGCIAAWVPRELNQMPGFTTNVEFGFLVKSGSLIYGRPENAPKTRYLDWLYSRFNECKIAVTLRELMIAAVSRTAMAK